MRYVLVLALLAVSVTSFAQVRRGGRPPGGVVVRRPVPGPVYRRPGPVYRPVPAPYPRYPRPYPYPVPAPYPSPYPYCDTISYQNTQARVVNECQNKAASFGAEESLSCTLTTSDLDGCEADCRDFNGFVKAHLRMSVNSDCAYQSAYLRKTYITWY